MTGWRSLAARIGRKRWAVAALCAAALGVFGSTRIFLARRAAAFDGLIQANGRLEGDSVSIASKWPGRIRQLMVGEGDAVERGQVILLVDDAQTKARLDQATAGLSQAETQVSQASAHLAEAQAAVGESQSALAQALARGAQAREAVRLSGARVRAAKTALQVLASEIAQAEKSACAAVESAKAAVSKAEAAEMQARRDAERFRVLAAEDVVERRRAELAELAWNQAKEETASARSLLTQAEQRLADARLGPGRIASREEDLRALEAQEALERAGVAVAEAAASQAQLAVRRAAAGFERAKAAEGQAMAIREHARAVVSEAQSSLSDLTIHSPITGVVMTKLTEVGEVVAAGSPLCEIVDLDQIYLKVFVPENQIGKVRLGLPAQIFTDAFPRRTFSGAVRYIASRAEFTPKEVQTPDERVKLVYAVKVYLESNPGHMLTPGLPADAMIRWKEGVPWRRPRW